MHVSLHLSPQSRGPHEDQAIIESLLEQAQAADRAGFAAVCLTEHHGSGFNTYTDPFVLGAHLAARLERAHIALTVAQVALHHPLRLVEQSNLLDVLTRGRCLIGLAAGSASPFELDAFGVAVEDRAELTRQRIESMVGIWARQEGDPPLDIATDWDAGTLRTRVTPAPYRRPHPLLARVTGTEATVVAAARAGWPVILGIWEGGTGKDGRLADLYRAELAAAEHDAGLLEECLSWLGFYVGVCVAETHEEAVARHEEHLRVGGNGPTPGKHGAPEAFAEEWAKRAVGRARFSFIGAPDTVAEHILGLREIGVQHVRVAMVDTVGEPERARDDFELFISEVLPALEPEALPGAPAPLRTPLQGSDVVGGETTVAHEAAAATAGA